MNNTTARDLIDQLAKNAIECSRQRNNGDVCYAYSYGFFSSSMQALIEDLGLTKKQMAALQEFVDYSQRRG